MVPTRHIRCVPVFCVTALAFLGLLACRALADDRVLVVLVQDYQHRPLKGIEIGIEGPGGSKTTGDDGKALLALPAGIAENDWVSLQIIHSPPGHDWMMFSPYDNRVIVPSFKNKPENFVHVFVVQRGDMAALQSDEFVRAAAEKTNKANAPKELGASARPGDPKANFEKLAKQYGYTPEQLDEAIRALGAKATDPYDVGLVALHERNYPKATAGLQESLHAREEHLAADQKAVADTALFLGVSLYQQGRYSESMVAYRRCLEIRGDDAGVLNNIALSMEGAGDYAGAEPLFRRALAIDEKALGPDDPEVAKNLNNLAELLREKGAYAEAEPLLRRALTIDERALGPDDPEVAKNLTNLAALLREKGDYAGAEPLFRRALAINQQKLGPDHPEVATTLSDLAALLRDKGDYAGAEPLFRRALEIDQRALGPDHPEVATDLNNLAELLRDKGDYAGAEPMFRRALATNEKALGADHPTEATILNNLAELLRDTGDYAGAEPFFRRALAINEQALGADHPMVALTLNNLANLLRDKRDYAGADPLYRRALAIDEKALGADHPMVATTLNNLANLLTDKGDYTGAEPLLRRALGIDQKALGPDHPTTKLIQANLEALIKKENEKKEK